MARGIKLPLPAFMDQENIRESINEQVSATLRKRGVNERTLPEHVRAALPETIEEQVSKLLFRDYGIAWNPASAAPPVLTRVPNRDGWELETLTPEQVTELTEASVKDIEEAITTGVFIGVGAVVALAAQGFPKSDN